LFTGVGNLVHRKFDKPGFKNAELHTSQKKNKFFSLSELWNQLYTVNGCWCRCSYWHYLTCSDVTMNLGFYLFLFIFILLLFIFFLLLQQSL